MKEITAVFCLLSVLFCCGCSKDDTNNDSNQDLNKGLVLHLPFTGNLNDFSINKNNGNFPVGTPLFVSDRFFDNSNSLALTPGQYVEISDKGLSGLEKFTFYIEFYPMSTGYSVLVGKRAFEVTPGKGYNQSFNIAINDNMQVLATFRKTGQCQSQELSAYHRELNSGANKVLLDCWNYVATSWDGTIQKLYLNGNLVAQQNLSEVVICDTDPVRLGVWWKGDPNYFDGLLDEFRVYNRVLSDNEVKQLYKVTK